MAESFFIFTMGPIQDFIASARRCHDLWYGSWLLSHLSRVVSQVVRESAGAESLIFPGSQELDDRKGIANKIVAVVPSEQVEAIAEQAERSVKKALLDELENASREARADRELCHLFLPDIARQQVEDMMEFFWVAVPCQSREGQAYVEARQHAEELLAARKNLHDWQAVTWGDYVPKSSLDGERESVLLEELYNYMKHAPHHRERARKVFGVEKEERLCGVGLLKRLGGDEQERRFHSTSHMASMPLQSHFERVEVRQAFDRFVEILQSLAQGNWLSSLRLQNLTTGFQGEANRDRYDGSIFFESRLVNLLDDYGMFADQDRNKIVSGIQQALEDMFQAMRQEGRPKPQPPAYYALLLADGDRMGVIIDHQEGFAAHRKLSKALDEFSGGVRAIVERYDGSLIYSGGDDVLALLPLHQAVECARKLADNFAERLGPFAFEKEGETMQPTLSVGIAIAHYLKPFGLVREQAKEAEKLAKKSRNALAVIIDKRSGGSRSVHGSWQENEAGMLPLDERLEEWQKIIAQQDVSHGFLYEVESIARFGQRDTEAVSSAEFTSFEKMLVHELERVMSRKEAGSRKEVGLSKEVKETLRGFVRRGAKERDVAASLRALSNELYLALEMYRVAAITYQRS